MLYLFYYTENYLLSYHGAEVPKTMQIVIATNGGNNKRVAFVNRLSAQTGHDGRLNDSRHNHA